MRHDGRSNIERPRLCQEWLRLCAPPSPIKKSLVATPILGMLLSAAAFRLIDLLRHGKQIPFPRLLRLSDHERGIRHRDGAACGFRFPEKLEKIRAGNTAHAVPQVASLAGYISNRRRVLDLSRDTDIFRWQSFMSSFFACPIITVLKVGWFLKERAAAYIWPVLALNFIGVLIALRPDRES